LVELARRRDAEAARQAAIDLTRGCAQILLEEAFINVGGNGSIPRTLVRQVGGPARDVT
jgi:hypothetical protein